MVQLLTEKFATIGGLPLTAVDDDGVTWILEKLTGWGSPGGSLEPVRMPRAPGSWVGDSFLDSRSMVASGAVSAPTPELAEAALDRLIDAISLDDTVIEVTGGGIIRYATVRRDGEVIPEWLNTRAFRYSAQMFAPDGRKFGAPVTLATVLPSSTGGLSVPFTVPFSIDSTVATGQVTIVNPGNTVGRVLIELDGPLDGPVITHSGAGALEVWSSSWSGEDGEFLLIDMEKRTVLANGQVGASRSNTITSRRWFGLDPGVNQFSFTAKTYNPASRMLVTATPAWE